MREPFQIVEIDQKFCTLSHAVLPCAADALASPCYNTRKTCQDVPNYTQGALTLSFTQAKDSVGVGLIPSLISVSSTPTQINPGGASRDKKALGVRSSITIILQDHPHSDYFVDPYRDERNYIATERGTFWTKWLARNPFYRNTPVRVIEGDLVTGQSKTRHYIIDNISGPDSRGLVTIKAKDILSLAEDEKALAPRASYGELVSDVNDTATTLVLTGDTASAYPAPGHVRIGNEIIYYSASADVSSQINLTGCIRGQKGTQANSANAGDRVQLCLDYVDQPVYTVLNDLLTTYGNVSPAFINLTTWASENGTWLSPFNVSGFITEPTGVTKLLAEICEQTLSYIWYDEREQSIRFLAVRPATETPVKIDSTNNILADSVSIKREEKERFSQVWIFHSQRDPTKKLDDESNWSRLRIAADGDNPYEETQVKKIYGRWLQTEAQAQSVANRLLSRYKRTPIYLEMQLDVKDGAIWTGDITDISCDGLVDATGAPITARFQILSAEEVEAGHKIAYRAINSVYFGNFSYWMGASAPNYASATDAEKATGCWWSGADGGISGEDGYQWQ